MTLRAIIFDVDGTLAETEEAHRQAFNQAFAEAGKPWRWSQEAYGALLTTTGGRERIRRYLVESGHAPDDAMISALHVRKNQIYADLLAQGAITPRPGVMRLIEDAGRHGIALAIATTTSKSNIAALLHVLNVADRFATIVTGEDVAAKKPDPEAYRQALWGLRLQAADCVAIEDSRNGLDAALACGIPTLVTPSCYTRSQKFPGAAAIFSSLDEENCAVDVAMLASILRRPMTAGPSLCADFT